MSFTNSDGEQLQDNLRGLSEAQGDAINLNTQFCWVVDGIRSPEPFFRNLHLLLRPESVLYFEGCSIAADVSEFYEAHKALNPASVARDTIFPVPRTFHVTFSPDVISRLCELSATRATNELFDHIKGYAGTEMLFVFHDAFDNSCLISEHVTESAIAECCVRLGATCHKERNINKRDPAQMRRVISALEKAQRTVVTRESWWKRLWKTLLNS